MTDYGLTAPGVDGSGGGTFFAEDPFATDTIFDGVMTLTNVGVPQAVADPFGNTLFDCRQFQGCRLFFGVKSSNALSAAAVSLSWFDMNGSPTGQRFIILPNGTDALGTSTGTCIVAHPHLGDQLRILLIPLGGPLPLQVNVFAAHRNSDTVLFSLGALVMMPDMLIHQESVTWNGGVTVDVFTNCIYAGPASFSFNCTTAITTWSITLSGLALDNAYHPISVWTPNSPGVLNDVITMYPVLLPATQLRMRFSNTSGVNGTFNACLKTDEWRAGAG